MKLEFGPDEGVVITYKNYKGVTSVRSIVPYTLWWGKTEYHPEEQWIITAWDQGKDGVRDFALKDIQHD